MESCRGSEFEIWLVTIIASLVQLACVDSAIFVRDHIPNFSAREW